LAEVIAVRLPADLLSGTEAGIGGSVEGHVFPHVAQRNASGSGRSVATRARRVSSNRGRAVEPGVRPGEAAVYKLPPVLVSVQGVDQGGDHDAYEGPVHFGRVNDGCRGP
jgi:hypothetical protein